MKGLCYSNSIHFKKENPEDKKTNYIKIILITLLSILILVAAFHFFSIHNMKKNTPPGNMVELDGVKIHCFKKGEGNPPVVFLSGEDSISAYTEFSPLMEKVSKFSTVVTYDRPGEGFSEKSKEKRNIEQMLYETHEVLKKSGIKSPYVLVCHSMATLEGLMFAEKYSGEVSGLVFLNGGNPSYYISQKLDRFLIKYSKDKLFRNSGWLRALGLLGFNSSLNEREENLPKDIKKLDREFFFQNYKSSVFTSKLKNYKESARQMYPSDSIKVIPTVVVTSKGLIQNEEFKDAQKNLMKWSYKSEQVIVEGDKYPHLQNTEEVADIIRNLLDRIADDIR